MQTFIKKEVDVMRTLNSMEIAAVAGGEGTCGPDDGNSLGGISNADDSGDFFVNLYEGAVAVTSHVIERVANAL